MERPDDEQQQERERSLDGGGKWNDRTTNNSKRGDPYIEAFLERAQFAHPPWERWPTREDRERDGRHERRVKAS